MKRNNVVRGGRTFFWMSSYYILHTPVAAAALHELIKWQNALQMNGVVLERKKSVRTTTILLPHRGVRINAGPSKQS